MFFPLQLEKLIEKNYYLHKSAQEAYKSYVRAYDSHSLKQIYNVHTLNLLMVALSFGFKVPPFVDLSILYKCLTLLEKLNWNFDRFFFFGRVHLLAFGVFIYDTIESLRNLWESFSYLNAVTIVA